MYIKHKFIKPDSIESRDYQINIANLSTKKNTLVVLPTGLGKTIIALILIAKELENEKNKILFLAPTKPLVNQHAHVLRKYLIINEKDIVIFTGEIAPLKRQEIWKKSRIIVSTPQVIENDLLTKRLNLENVSFVIFDESHHAIGEYAYVYVSEMYKKHRINRHVLGITASPGSDISKILDVCNNLDIKNIEIRTKHDPDVKQYIHDIKIRWKEVYLPKNFSIIIQLLRLALSERLKLLKNVGVIESTSISLINRKKLLDAQKKIQSEILSKIKPHKILYKAASVQSEALKIYYSIELLQTQGVNAIKNYFNRIGKEVVSKNSSKASRSVMADKNITEAFAYINSLEIEHPKMFEILKIVKKQFKEKPNSKLIIFTHYRDTSSYVFNLLKNVKNVSPVRFIGQAGKDGDKGLSQKQQADVINKFKENYYNILIATSVAEEGLDIPSTDLVIFYEPIPSEIRNIQRRGRTGRKMSGEVIILITKGTSDEGYYWAAKRKEKRMRLELELLRSTLYKNIEEEKIIFNKNFENIHDQKKLEDYEIEEDKIKVIVDHREYRSKVVRNLTANGINVESQQLDVGDYILSSRIGVERKSVDDFLASLIEGKLFRQIAQLRDAYSRPVLILEGEDLLTKRNINHNAIYGSLASINVDFGVPIISTKNSSETADLIQVIANREQRDIKKTVTIREKKPPLSLREQQQFMIEGLPNISSILAKRLLDHFGSIKEIINSTDKELREVKGIGKNISTEILELLNANYLRD